MKIRLLVVFLLLFTRAFPQNLVNNPGFEDHTSCPYTGNQLNLCNGWSNCNGQYASFNCGSPDYLSTCGTGFANLPNSGEATVYPHSGEACADYTTYDGGADYREYIETFLTSPLEIGKTYTVSYWLTTGNSQNFDYHTNNNGVLFSVDTLNYCSEVITRYTPQYNDTNIFDSTDWQLFTFQFTADSAYKYITFGDFYLDSQSKIVKANNTGNSISQVYIDDISVVPNTTPCNNPNLVNNPDFENHTACPTTGNQLNLCNGWSNCNGQYATFNCGSPDYLSTCGTGFASLPVSGEATIFPYSGEACADYTTYDGGTDYREYIETFLTSPLVKGNTYTVSYYLATGTSQDYDYHTNNNGVLFSVDTLHYCSEAITGYTPQYNDTNVFDSTNWQLFTFQFTADSAYKYITFGDFYLDAQSKIVKANNTGNSISQVYLDDISVSEVCSSAGINSPSLSVPTISFYPDPIADYATFDLENLNGKTLTFTLFNCLGQQVMLKDNINTSKFIFNRGSLSAGMYFYQFRAANGSVSTGKMILD